MKKSEYIPAVSSLISMVERHKSSLTVDELRIVHRVKNWVREKEEDSPGVTPARIERKVRDKQTTRGIAI